MAKKKKKKKRKEKKGIKKVVRLEDRESIINKSIIDFLKKRTINGTEKVF